MKRVALILPLLLGACGGDDDGNLITIEAPPEVQSNPLTHPKNPLLAAPTEEELGKAIPIMADFMARMSVYGFFPEQDTEDKRRAYSRRYLSQLPGQRVRQFLDIEIDKYAPLFLESDPANLVTFVPGVNPGLFLTDLLRATRGAIVLESIEASEKGVKITQEGTTHVLPTEDPVATVEVLNGLKRDGDGRFHIFKAEGEAVGTSWFSAAHLKKVSQDGFNPYE